MTAKKKALVVCPGRGTYNKEELGYLKRHHAGRKELIASLDAARQAQGQTTVSALDGRDKFTLAEHSRGDNASPLIYASAYADFLAIDRNKYDIVAVTGNSMGWYIALGCAGAAPGINAFEIVNTMGALMQEHLTGGQLIHTLVDENWREIPRRREALLKLISEVNAKPGCEAYISIELGGMLVFGGNDAALAALEKGLKPEGRFPMRLQNHAAFHTPLLKFISDKARGILGPDLFQAPKIPLIDGRGGIWTPWSTDVAALWDYTLGHQIHVAYDFTRAMQVAVHEFAPDCVILLGPGGTLGGAVAQSLISIGWQGWHQKDDFARRQKESPYLLSMGLDEQRALAA
jgi:acyl transferase domain-containing protein